MPALGLRIMPEKPHDVRRSHEGGRCRGWRRACIAEVTPPLHDERTNGSCVLATPVTQAQFTRANYQLQCVQLQAPHNASQVVSQRLVRVVANERLQLVAEGHARPGGHRLYAFMNSSTFVTNLKTPPYTLRDINTWSPGLNIMKIAVIAAMPEENA